MNNITHITKTNKGDIMKFSKKYYKKILDEHQLKKSFLKNMFFAFIFGGLICFIGEGIKLIYDSFNLDGNLYMLYTVIFVAILLSGFGLYDKIGQIGKCGLTIPITGFANSMSSSAIEYKPEGFILGLGANVFKLAGTVIVFGAFSAFIVATIKYLVVILL